MGSKMSQDFLVIVALGLSTGGVKLPSGLLRSHDVRQEARRAKVLRLRFFRKDRLLRLSFLLRLNLLFSKG